jgi:hypothetical protein
VDGFKAYKYYIAIKLHFSKDNFDVFKNRGAVKGTREAFNARNDRYIFEKLARKYPVDKDIIQYFVANFAYGSDSVVYSQDDAESNLIEWTRRKESITKIFSDDCSTILMDAYKKKLKESSVKNFTFNQYPSILTLYLGKQISLETLRIIDDFEPVIETWKSNSSMILLWENEIRRVDKSRGFVKYDSQKVQSIYQSFKEELAEL